jgi:hypothetical protein
VNCLYEVEGELLAIAHYELPTLEHSGFELYTYSYAEFELRALRYDELLNLGDGESKVRMLR